MKKIIVWILIIVGIFSLLWLTGKNKISNSQNESVKIPARDAVSSVAGEENQLVASETFYDFGVISMKNGNVSKMFKVSNLGDKDINLQSVSTSCMCTVAYVIKQDGNKKGPFGMPGHGGAVPKTNELIKSGESRDIEVVYDPNAHGPAGVGMIDRFVYLEDANGKKLQLEIKANVTP
ncbi:hypothetical protein A3B85_00590 [Candidatus Nomurabacteria bacterium RIFCSPHIGHO2_02_FULL_37_13]|uniref:DUF1573 domain-containing protein n=1 Tax=Candidatus Nomurabacteria bacterium RIFCSPHIGHO2_02_FULL_37_13 TaxID=1801750 RepID=A0A1F6W6A0_9BACT|nr:MAG: hypothetical protein A2640_02730 [Candidatus Nomurabacteria bacterium RIFCSPHIGHO2_01_FULL_36_23]OGI77457.1 MAG: hypothetical protein A3B85_00590 [Candidatus Nomurabacteria bacterium RIFCSPHIGHO2_02_FULL_37_13]OGI87528.1 MAG: hypothetical protein A2906_01065 [Candidatus Nomurabacteria bacterium RIFCSPLOWO2_01_FULL_37_25]